MKCQNEVMRDGKPAVCNGKLTPNPADDRVTQQDEKTPNRIQRIEAFRCDACGLPFEVVHVTE